jgi:arylsulfatase A-like enzyme
MTERDLNRIKSYYYGMISENDKYIGLILEQLAKLGLEDRTLVIFNADHGEMLGDHGLVFKGGYFYDQVMQAPLIIRAPGRLPAGKRIKTIVEEIDLLPTILDVLDIKISERIQGRSLVPIINGSSNSSRAAHAEFPNAKMLRTEQWKLVHYLHAPYGELYNLRDDPYEIKNLYDDPAAAGARHEMESALADWLIDSQDPSLKPVQAEKG